MADSSGKRIGLEAQVYLFSRYSGGKPLGQAPARGRGEHPCARRSGIRHSQRRTLELGARRSDLYSDHDRAPAFQLGLGTGAVVVRVPEHVLESRRRRLRAVGGRAGVRLIESGKARFFAALRMRIKIKVFKTRHSVGEKR